jgi:hypothetical protein
MAPLPVAKPVEQFFSNPPKFPHGDSLGQLENDIVEPF